MQPTSDRVERAGELVDVGAAWVSRLGRVSRAVQQHLAPRSAVSLAQAEVLALLDAQGQDAGAGLAVSELAVRRGCSQPAMSQMVERLVAAGLVVRGPAGHDRRVAVVSATAQGRAVLGENRRRAAAVLGERMLELPAAQRELLDRAAPVLDRLLEESC